MTAMIETSETESVSRRVIAEVAEVTGTDPLELEPLYARVDPDRLDAIFTDAPEAAGRTHGRITFPMAGCRVTVEADGTVDVTEQDQRMSASPTSRPTASSGAVESPD